MIRKREYDRFIPNRQDMNIDIAQYHLEKKFKGISYGQETLEFCLFGGALTKGKILPLSHPPIKAEPRKETKIRKRIEDMSALKVLDAPRIGQDFYTIPLDWSAKGMIAINLFDEIYMYNLEKTESVNFSSAKRTINFVKALKFNEQGDVLATGALMGLIEIWDVETCCAVGLKTTRRDRYRINALDWKQEILAVGSSGAVTYMFDPRQEGNLAYLGKETSTDQVCNVKWSLDGKYLAVGSENNALTIWDCRTWKTLTKFERTSAVKGIAWSPNFPSQIASGGGVTDCKIVINSIHTQNPIREIDTGFQVTSLHWLDEQTLLSTEGSEPSCVKIWDAKRGISLCSGVGHENRILYSVLSPNKDTLVTASSDETLRFWDVRQFKVKSKQPEEKKSKLWYNEIR